VPAPRRIEIRRGRLARGASAGYDPLLWKVLRMPCLNALGPDGEPCLLLLDTGLGEGLRVSADVAMREGLPARTTPPLLAWVDRLGLADGVSLRHVAATVHPMRWEARVLGLPVYRLSGYILGLPVLRAFASVEFDNRRRSVRFLPAAPFSPDEPRQWGTYPMRVDDGVLTALVPIAGRTLRVCPDTGGGPVIVLTPEDWAEIADHVRVLGHSRGRFPSWNGFVPCDRYTLDELGVGNYKLRRPTVWVRTRDEPADPAPTLLGLGPLRHTTVVYDFKSMQLWVRHGRDPEPAAPLSRAGLFVRRPPGW
jgi:hypothetical protein